MEFTLTSEEHELVLRFEQHHRGLLKEIWRTDHRDFRLALRERRKSARVRREPLAGSPESTAPKCKLNEEDHVETPTRVNDINLSSTSKLGEI